MPGKRSICAFIVILLSTLSALAHQPVIVGKDVITIEKPEISRAFYHELTGEPRSYYVKADKPFDLFVGLLVPRNTNPNGRYSARVYSLAEGKRTLLADIKADSIAWKEMYEPFGGDHYLTGPDWKRNVPAGQYEIEVYSQDNRGKYALVVGEGEFWGPKEILSVYTEVPKLKAGFFGSNPLSFLVTPFGLVLVVIAGAVIYYIVRK